jgi:hypothetical protein
MTVAMRERLRGSIGVVLVAAFLAAIVPVCPCTITASERGEHACCAPPLSLRGSDDDCCAPSLTIEGVAGESPSAVAPADAPAVAIAPALLARGVPALAVAVAFAPSPPAILRI